MNLLFIFRFLWLILYYNSFFFLSPLYHLAHICIRVYANDQWALELFCFFFSPSSLGIPFLCSSFWIWSLLWNYCFQRENIEAKTWPKVSFIRRTNKWESKTSQLRGDIQRTKLYSELESVLLESERDIFGFQDKPRHRL